MEFTPWSGYKVSHGKRKKIGRIAMASEGEDEEI